MVSFLLDSPPNPCSVVCFTHLILWFEHQGVAYQDSTYGPPNMIPTRRVAVGYTWTCARFQLQSIIQFQTSSRRSCLQKQGSPCWMYCILGRVRPIGMEIGGDFLIARYTVLYTYCFFGPSTPIPFYSPLTLPSFLFTHVSCRKQWVRKASGSTRQALQNAVCHWNSTMQTDCGVSPQRLQIQHSEAEINFYVLRYCTKHKWCVNQLCS